MKISIFSILIFFAWPIFAQNEAWRQFYRANTSADSLFQLGQYRQSAKLFSAATKMVSDKGGSLDYSYAYYQGANAWERVGQRDSAFVFLNKLADDCDFKDYKYMEETEDFPSLKSDKRWVPLINKIKINQQQERALAEKWKTWTTFDNPQEDVVFTPFPKKIKAYIANDTLPFISINHGIYRLYFRGDSYAAGHLPEVKEQVDLAYHRALAVLDTTKYLKGINVILLDSPEEMEAINGFYVRGGLAMPQEHLLFMVFNSNRTAPFLHEIFHVISVNTWGNIATSAYFLIEGSAVYAENPAYFCHHTIYEINALFLKKELMFSLQSLITDYSRKMMENEIIYYLQGAGIFKYLYEMHGPDKMRRLWQEGFDNFLSIYGYSVADFEKKWLDFIRTIPAPEDIDWDYMMKGCNGK